MSNIMRDDNLLAAQRWELKALDGDVLCREGARSSENHPSFIKLPKASEIEELQNQAYQEAYDRGLREGQEQARQDITDRIQRLDALLQSLAQPFAELDEQVEQELAALAIAMTRQLVRRELKTSPGEIFSAIQEALAVLPANQRDILVHLHPDDARLVRENLAKSGGDALWRMIEDSTVMRGGCLVVTEISRVDARLETRLVIQTVFGGERSEDRIANDGNE